MIKVPFAMLPHCIQLHGHTFCVNYALVKILSRNIFISILMKESCGRVHRHEFIIYTLYTEVQFLRHFLELMEDSGICLTPN